MSPAEIATMRRLRGFIKAQKCRMSPLGQCLALDMLAELDMHLEPKSVRLMTVYFDEPISSMGLDSLMGDLFGNTASNRGSV